MSTPVPAILGIFTVAGMSLIVTGCDDWDDFGRLVEGKPTKAQVAHEQSVSLHLSSAPPVVEQEVEVAAPCQIIGPEFRTHMCTEDGRKILIP